MQAALRCPARARPSRHSRGTRRAVPPPPQPSSPSSALPPAALDALLAISAPPGAGPALVASLASSSVSATSSSTLVDSVDSLAPSAAAVTALFLAAASASPVVDLAEGLEEPVQVLYLVFLLGFLVGGAYLVVRQVLIRRELEEAAKALGERIRTGAASAEDRFELGVILLRKKLYTTSLKNLESARAAWDGAPADLAQVHNAIGFANFQVGKLDAAVEAYSAAVGAQPGYVTAWNNLGDAHEARRDWGAALAAYEEALAYDPANRVARARADSVRAKAKAAR